ncbi:hypothetical protein GCM10023235_12560 [Kitasatospora terrestris]|uniref:Uncharacterized protein n=1 Tax=Kitasatospora terrestris TaxID=258051 RepID=A0ABP9DFP3_9ACTN
MGPGWQAQQAAQRAAQQAAQQAAQNARLAQENARRASQLAAQQAAQQATQRGAQNARTVRQSAEDRARRAATRRPSYQSGTPAASGGCLLVSLLMLVTGLIATALAVGAVTLGS